MCLLRIRAGMRPLHRSQVFAHRSFRKFNESEDIIGIAMAVTLSISSTELSEDRIQTLTSDLCRSIIKETDIEAELAEDIYPKGAKGEPITLGLIVLTFLSGGSAVALINVLKSYFERDSTLEVSIEQKNGAKLAINAKNMKPEQIEDTFNKVKEFIGNWNE
jgi:hypothetical protein